jgi:UTP:GlnB (protein PII) uridylyltransferase
MREGSSSSVARVPFEATMPERYGESFDSEAIARHEAIVARRGSLPAHVEICGHQPGGVTIVCVVADDRPGLLSRIAASLVIHSIDILSAQAYTRMSPSGSGEAVDFLWLRRIGGGSQSLSELECERVADVLRALVTGERSMDAEVSGARPAPRQAFATRIAMSESPNGELLMTIEASDRPGLLLAITRSLFRAGVQIVASVATTENGRVVDHFTIVEIDGSPVREKRRRALQSDVLAAVDAVARSSNPPRS